MVVQGPLDMVAMESMSEEMNWDDIPMIKENQAQENLQTNNPGRRNSKSKVSDVRTSPMGSRGITDNNQWVIETGEDRR